jgi:hypothetical protein
MTRIHLILAILATILASLWFAEMVKAQTYHEPYRGDHIDKERRLDRKALRSHRCFWYGECRGNYYKARHYRRHRYYTAPRPDSEIMASQIRLRDLGYEIEADGFMGPETRRAVERFQEERDLRVSGELDENTTDALKSNDREHFHDDNDRDRSRCLSSIVYALSRHSTSEANAKSSAQERWMDLVQAARGGLYMNLQLAEDTRWRCFQSQAHSSFLGKAQELGSKIVGGEGHHMMCEVWARPCAAPIEDGKE